MGVNFAFNWELQLIEWLQNAGGSVGAALASFFTMFGEELVLVAVLGFLYWCWDKELAQYVGLLIVTGLVSNTLLKNLVLRRRPYFDHMRIKCLKPVSNSGPIDDLAAQGFSFPSGHSTNSAIVYGGIAAWLWKKTDPSKGPKEIRKRRLILVIGIGLPLLVGISRFILGVHYPTDVLVGWLMGIVLIVLLTWLREKVSRKWLHLIIFLISALGIFYCDTTDYFTGLGIMAGYFLALEFEERHVRFDNTHKLLPCILRLIGGFAVYLGLNALLKLPFPEDFLQMHTLASHLVRTARYTIVAFAALGLYPMVFKYKPFSDTKKEKNSDGTVRAVLFDFDGTVFDTVEGITKSIQYALEKHGTEATLEELRCFAGPPLVNKFMEVYGVSQEEAEELVTDFRERYKPIGIYESSPFPGIGTLLAKLREDGYKLAVSTSKPTPMAELLLKRSDLYEYFDVVIGSGPGGINNEPKWKIVQDAMHQCGADTDHAVLIGDTKYDVEGAARCGIPCIGVRWGYAADGELEQAGAVSIAADMDELLEQIRALI